MDPIDTRERIERLLARMTLEEKVSMTAGSDRWRSTGIPRLGIPTFKMTDGPNGARGEMRPGQTSACFPCGIAFAATWNPALIEQVGHALADEARSKGADVLLGPTINLHRTPLGGRTFECYSEDPHLTAGIASALVRGLQARGVGACLKHFVCNDSEFERRSISSEVDERALRELYLRAFELTLRAADPWMVMSAYNRINGVYASSHRELLRGVLKDEWGFEGVVVSDWGGSMDTVGDANAGLDLEMPGPGRRLGVQLLEAVRAGEVTEKEIDDKVRRLLRLMLRAGRLDSDPGEDEVPAEERSEDRPEIRALARRVAADSMVLLRNDGILPLAPERLRRLAIVGPLAERGQIMGGGSAFVLPHYQVHPLEALRERLEPGVELVHAPGCRIPRFATPIPAEALRCEDGSPGLDVRYWNGPGFDGEPASQLQTTQGLTYFGRTPPPHVDQPTFAVRFTSTFTPTETGVHTFGVCATGRSRLYLDDRELIDNWTDPTWTHDVFGAGQSTERRHAVVLEAGRAYALRIEYLRPRTPTVVQVRFGALPPEPEGQLDRAVGAAASSDAALVFVGTTGDWETEGRDRESLDLPDPQNELVEQVLAAQPRSIVVVNAGSPTPLPWLERAAAVLYAWFPGQEYGHALADVLIGDREAGGRLPLTFPARIEDTPAFTCYPGEHGKVHYGENLFMGYRWYDTRKIEPRLPFGHGLSYTRFRYGELRASDTWRIGTRLDVECDVTNVGERVGSEVVQLYVRALGCPVAHPDKELRAFAKLRLGPGETGTARFCLDDDDLAYWSPADRAWRTPPGEIELAVGASSRDLRTSIHIQRFA